MNPNQLIPSQPYTLSYFLTDHTDGNTYYVRAVVYDATTGEVLDTQDLVQQSTNPRLFSKRAQAPGDSSGHGRKIIVVATAYEDAGYTTKSSLYQEQSENYLVIKAGAGLTLGGGYGTGVDYRIIKEIVEDQLKSLIKSINAISKSIANLQKTVDNLPTEKTDTQEIVKELGVLRETVAGLPTEPADIAPLLLKIDEVKQAVEDKEVTPKTELEPILTRLDEVKEEVGKNHNENMNNMTPLIEAFKETLPKVLEKEIKTAVSKQKFTLAPIGIDVKGESEMEGEEEPEQKKERPFDIRKLTSQID